MVQNLQESVDLLAEEPPDAGGITHFLDCRPGELCDLQQSLIELFVGNIFLSGLFWGDPFTHLRLLGRPIMPCTHILMQINARIIQHILLDLHRTSTYVFQVLVTVCMQMMQHPLRHGIQHLIDGLGFHEAEMLDSITWIPYAVRSKKRSLRESSSFSLMVLKTSFSWSSSLLQEKSLQSSNFFCLVWVKAYWSIYLVRIKLL